MHLNDVSNMTLEYCFDPTITRDSRWIIDINLNAFFIIYFVIRVSGFQIYDHPNNNHIHNIKKKEIKILKIKRERNCLGFCSV